MLRAGSFYWPLSSLVPDWNNKRNSKLKLQVFSRFICFWPEKKNTSGYHHSIYLSVSPRGFMGSTSSMYIHGNSAARQFRWQNQWWGTSVCWSVCHCLDRLRCCDSQLKTSGRKHVSLKWDGVKVLILVICKDINWRLIHGF